MDNSKPHTDKEFAKEKYGTDDVLIRGTHIMAFGTEYADHCRQAMEDVLDTKLTFMGESVKFRGTVIPNARITWVVTSQNMQERYGIKHMGLNISGFVGDNKVATVVPRFSQEPHVPPKLDVPPCFTRSYALNKPTVEDYCMSAAIPAGDTLPRSMGYLFMPAAVLDLLGEKTGTRDGVNRAMNVFYFREPTLGELKIQIYPPAREGKETKESLTGQKSYAYNLRLLATQENEPILYAEMKCFTGARLDFNLPSNQPATDTDTQQPPQPS